MPHFKPCVLWLAAPMHIALLAASIASAEATVQLLDAAMHHLRVDGPREWSEFPHTPESDRLVIHFDSRPSATEYALRLRQQDVKQQWDVWLGETRLGRLLQDENDMVVYFSVPAGSLADGENELRIEQQAGARATPDDIRVGEIALIHKPVQDALSSATIEVEVLDAESQRHLPARITVLDENGALHTLGAESNDHLAVRPGTVYTSIGKARFGLPPGRYTIFAGRGFEYSLASAPIEVRAGDAARETLTIRREVPTEGYVACDTHIHTLTHSGHGDATDRERMITIAAEGIELAIATDHNVAIDYESVAREMNVRQFFTPVIGNEVTTRVGHFNVFPIMPRARMPDATLTDWHAIFEEVYATPGVRVVILNHARDLHSGVRPFGPKLHLDVVGENIEGWQLRAHGMEVVNSGATQTDVLQLFHDWMALLNRGHWITPVGSSDSHDVARHFVGQGRTYIRCDDADPANIDVNEAVESFLAGHVMVSYGLLAELTVAGEFRSGDLAPVAEDRVRVSLRVLGPSWTTANRVLVYANGTVIREWEIPATATESLPKGVKWEHEFDLPRPAHDVHLVAIALGPGVERPYWKTAKPYQPTSPDWQPHVLGCSGAVWLDADGDGRGTSAREYAERMIGRPDADLEQLVKLLHDYDAAVAAQAAHLFRENGGELRSTAVQEVLDRAAPATKLGFRQYLEAWRTSEIARAQD